MVEKVHQIKTCLHKTMQSSTYKGTKEKQDLPELMSTPKISTALDSREEKQEGTPASSKSTRDTENASLRRGSFAMSPVAEEVSLVETPTALSSSQTIPFVGETGHKYRAGEARSLGAPSSSAQKAAKPSLARSSSDLEDVSLLSEQHTFPQHVVFRSEFDFENLSSDWEEPAEYVPPFDEKMNCFGVVHVRVLRAQRLPCPVGSGVQAIVSLPPWKGRIRTRKTSAFAGSRRHGVCCDWSDDESAISMVHAYSSQESPVPSIKIDVVFSIFGVFEVNICTLSISCEALFRQPMFPQRQWFRTIPHTKESEENIPLIQVEAMFEPEEKNTNSATLAPMEVVEVHRRESTDESMLESNASALASVTTSTMHTRQPPSRQQSLSDPSLTPAVETGNLAKESQGTSSILKSPQRISKSRSPPQSLAFDERSDLSASLVSYRKTTSNISTKVHLLRTKNFYTPTCCSICGKSIMSGIWKVLAFRCEECGIDCCSDCRLQVDVQLPCGSEEARKAVEAAADSQFTADKLLRWVAPIEESIGHFTHGKNDSESVSKGIETVEEKGGIGKIRFNFLQAFILRDSLPEEFELDLNPTLEQLKRGDYYVRVVRLDTNKSFRTRTVQRSTRPQFDSSEIVLNVPHYASEFRIELVDATDDQPIGFFLLTAQMLLQEQRDDAIKQFGMPIPQISFKKRKVIRELRKFVKSGDAKEYFTMEGAKTSAEIVGMLEFQVVLDEDHSALYGSTPYLCPPRPKDELDLAKFQAHIRRISQLIADVKSTIHTLNYVVSWENKYLTGISFVIFAGFCYRVHPDHFFTGPVFVALLYMLYLAFLRTHGSLKLRYLDKELSTLRKSTAAPEYLAVHRPVGLVRASVGGGKNIRSPEMGLPGNVSCRVSIDFARYCDEKQRKELASVDSAVEASHIVGSTETVYSTSPRWSFLEESDETKRLKHVVPSRGEFFENGSNKQNVGVLEFPVLQPIVRDTKTKELELRPWSSSKAALIFEVVFHDFAKILPGSEYTLGEVVLPLSEIAQKSEISGWFKLTQSITTDSSPISNPDEGEIPIIQVRVKWLPPVKIEGLPADVEREASIVMQEELARASKLAQKKTVGLVGSSLGAINTVRGISGYILAIQNGLGSLLDAVEAARHLINFSDPLKSSAVVIGLLMLWFVLYSIPFRLLVFLLGTIPYASSLKARYEKSVKRNRRHDFPPEDRAAKKLSPFSIWVNNFMRSLPIDDDLRKTYFWETRREVAKLLCGEADERRSSRLQKLWRAQWYEEVDLFKMAEKEASLRPRKAFAVIQGRRFMWWSSVHDFDNGEQPIGKIFLQGHAGLATPSPIEMKAIGDDMYRAVSLFGRGEKEQERVTFMVKGLKSKDAFERAVNGALFTKSD